MSQRTTNDILEEILRLLKSKLLGSNPVHLRSPMMIERLRNWQRSRQRESQLFLADMSSPELTVRVLNILESEDVETLEELSRLTKQQLSQMRNCGTTSVNQIIAFAKSHGVEIRDE